MGPGGTWNIYIESVTVTGICKYWSAVTGALVEMDWSTDMIYWNVLIKSWKMINTDFKSDLLFLQYNK